MIELFPSYYSILHVLFLAAMILSAVAVFFLNKPLRPAIGFSPVILLLRLCVFLPPAPPCAKREGVS